MRIRRVTGRARRARRDERGLAMALTVVAMLIVTALTVVMFTIGVQALPLARHAQNYQAALQAADSGVEDYINRLDNNTSYWQQTADAANPAMKSASSWTTWASVPGPNANEWYRYYINNSGTAQTGVVYLTVSGAAGQNPAVTGNHYAVRTIKVALEVAGFTSYLYYTDYELIAPSISGLPSSCVLHAWEYNTTNASYGPALSGSNSCTSEIIYFVGQGTQQDGLHGSVFSNDELHICGNPSFPTGATTAYNQSTSLNATGVAKYGGAGSYYGSSGCTNTPTFGGSGTQPAGAPDSPFPTTNTSLQSDLSSSNAGGGCAYTGPVTIVFSVASGVGKMSVTLASGSSVDTTHTPSGQVCTGSNIALPPNGLIYDQNGSCGASCNANVTASGTVAGKLTIGSQTNITLIGNLLVNNLNGTDIIGLSATNSIILNPPTSTNNLTIDAAMVALSTSFYVSNWSSIPAEGILTINGSVAQKFRGPVGTFDGSGNVSSGFSKNYVYDPRLGYEQPPYFTSPTLPNWVKTNLTECISDSTPDNASC